MIGFDNDVLKRMSECLLLSPFLFPFFFAAEMMDAYVHHYFLHHRDCLSLSLSLISFHLYLLKRMFNDDVEDDDQVMDSERSSSKMMMMSLLLIIPIQTSTSSSSSSWSPSTIVIIVVYFFSTMNKEIILDYSYRISMIEFEKLLPYSSASLASSATSETIEILKERESHRK